MLWQITKWFLDNIGEEKRNIPTIYRRHVSSPSDTFYCCRCRWYVDQTNLSRHVVKSISGIVKVMNTIKHVNYNKGEKLELQILCIQKLALVKTQQLYINTVPRGEYTLKVLQANDEYLLFCISPLYDNTFLRANSSHLIVMLFALNLVTPSNPHCIEVFI